MVFILDDVLRTRVSRRQKCRSPEDRENTQNEKKKKTWRCCFFKDIPFFISQVFQRFSPPSYSNLILYRRMKSITIERRFEPTMSLQQWHIFLFLLPYKSRRISVSTIEFKLLFSSYSFCWHRNRDTKMTQSVKSPYFFFSLSSFCCRYRPASNNNKLMDARGKSKGILFFPCIFFFFTLAHNFIRQRPQ